MSGLVGYILNATYVTSGPSGRAIVHLYGRLQDGRPFLVRDGREPPSASTGVDTKPPQGYRLTIVLTWPGSVWQGGGIQERKLKRPWPMRKPLGGR